MTIPRFFRTDSISYEIHGFWGSLWRAFIPMTTRWWWNAHIRPFYAPQHSNLRAAIPKTWVDLDACVEEFLFAVVINFVEDEEGLDDWEVQDGPRKEQAAMLREVYNWAKEGRFAAAKRLYSSRPKVTLADFCAGKGDYRSTFEMMEEMEAKTRGYLEWIVKWVPYMWT